MCGKKVIRKILNKIDAIKLQYLLLREWFTISETLLMIVLPLISKRGYIYYHNKILTYLSLNYSDIVEKYKIVQDYDGELNFSYDTIYVFWYQGFDLIPDLLKKCFKSVEKYRGNYKLVLLTKENMGDYVSIPKSIESRVESGEISFTHFSDIIRNTILSERGGIWLDATIYLTDELDIPPVPFYTIKRPMNPNRKIVSDQKWTTFFIAGYPNNPLTCFTRDLLCSYFEKESKLIDYFLFDYAFELCYRTCPAAKKLVDDIPYNNTNVWFLDNNINQKYEDKEFSVIRKNTNVFKLSYKTPIIKRKDNSLSYYDSIIADML